MTPAFDASVLLLMINCLITWSKFTAEQLTWGLLFYSHFDNVMAQFIINKRTDALKKITSICLIAANTVYFPQAIFLREIDIVLGNYVCTERPTYRLFTISASRSLVNTICRLQSFPELYNRMLKLLANEKTGSD